MVPCRLPDELQTLLGRIAEWQGTRPGCGCAARRSTRSPGRRRRSRGTSAAGEAPGFQAEAHRPPAATEQGARGGSRGSEYDEDMRLRNSVEWVRRGKAKLYVLTETADSDYRARFAWQGRPTAEDAAYFPNPDSDISAVDTGTASPTCTTAERLGSEECRAGQAGRRLEPSRLHCRKRSCHRRQRDLFFQTLRHEVQHDADKHRGHTLSHGIRAAVTPEEEEFQTALREYKTEYRAHSYQGGPPTSRCPAHALPGTAVGPSGSWRSSSTSAPTIPRSRPRWAAASQRPSTSTSSLRPTPTRTLTARVSTSTTRSASTTCTRPCAKSAEHGSVNDNAVVEVLRAARHSRSPTSPISGQAAKAWTPRRRPLCCAT